MRPVILALATGLALSPLAAVAAPSTPAAPAAPATGGVNDEARCLMTMAAFTGAKDPNTANSAQFGVAYFAGRIKARDPSYDLGTRLKAVAAGMSGQNVQAEADRCGAMVLQALKELQVAQAAFGPPPSGAGTGAKPSGGQPPKRP
jgi:hypothetical protein